MRFVGARTANHYSRFHLPSNICMFSLRGRLGCLRRQTFPPADCAVMLTIHKISILMMTVVGFSRRNLFFSLYLASSPHLVFGNTQFTLDNFLSCKISVFQRSASEPFIHRDREKKKWETFYLELDDTFSFFLLNITQETDSWAHTKRTAM